MYKVIVLFGKPVDENAFERYFEEQHRPLIGQLPDLQMAHITTVLGAVEGDSPFYLVLELCYASEQSLQDSLNSDQGQAMAHDYSLFASGGVTVLIGHAETI